MNRLKDLRTITKKTQQNIADFLQMSRRGYQKIENGESQIKQEKASQLADYFGISTSVLLGFRDTSDSLGFRLWTLRNEKNIELRKAAKDLNLSEEELKLIEKTDNGELGTTLAKDFANYYDVTVSYLLGYENDKKLIEELSQKMKGMSRSEMIDFIFSDEGDLLSDTMYYESVKEEQDKDAQNKVDEMYLRFITDPKQLDTLKSDALVAIRFIESLESRLSHGKVETYSYATTMNKISSQLLDLIDRIDQRKKELTN